MEPLERYRSLCSEASNESKRFYEKRRLLVQTANVVAASIHAFLGMPEGGTKIVEIGTDRKIQGAEKPIGAHLDLMADEDGLSYFGIALYFDQGGGAYFGAVTLVIGIDASDGEFRVKHLTVHRLSELTMQSLEPFLSSIYSDLLEHYANPRYSKRASIGFIS